MFQAKNDSSLMLVAHWLGSHNIEGALKCDPTLYPAGPGLETLVSVEVTERNKPFCSRQVVNLKAERSLVLHYIFGHYLNLGLFPRLGSPHDSASSLLGL